MTSVYYIGGFSEFGESSEVVAKSSRLFLLLVAIYLFWGTSVITLFLLAKVNRQLVLMFINAISQLPLWLMSVLQTLCVVSLNLIIYSQILGGFRSR